MDSPPWKDLLMRWSSAVLSDPELVDDLPANARSAGWLGYPGATHEQLARCERRLAAQLPPSYRAFLRVSNGWYKLDNFIDRLLSTEEVNWFATGHRQWLDTLTDDPEPIPDELYYIYGDEQQTWAYRPEYLRDSLAVSTRYDGAILLLNPHVVTPTGEWEAIFLASWFPGAQRYRSFLNLMQEQYEEYRQLRVTEQSG